MSAAENLIIAHGLTPYLIAGIGALVSALCVTVTLVIKLSMAKINTQILSCKDQLMTEIKLINAHAKETRRIADDSAQDIQDHVNVFEHKKR